MIQTAVCFQMGSGPVHKAYCKHKCNYGHSFVTTEVAGDIFKQSYVHGVQNTLFSINNTCKCLMACTFHFQTSSQTLQVLSLELPCLSWMGL